MEKISEDIMAYFAEKLSEEFQQAQENVKQEYLNTLTDCVKDFTFEIENKQKELNKIENQLKDIQNKVDNAVEAAKRAEELRQEKDFYKLQLSDIDIQEIEKLGGNVTWDDATQIVVIKY